MRFVAIGGLDYMQDDGGRRGDGNATFIVIREVGGVSDRWLVKWRDRFLGGRAATRRCRLYSVDFGPAQLLLNLRSGWDYNIRLRSYGSVA